MSMSSSTPRKNLSSHLIWSDAERDADATQKSALSSVQDDPYFFDGEGDDLLYGTLSRRRRADGSSPGDVATRRRAGTMTTRARPSRWRASGTARTR
jgi:hypothetical protein